VWGFLLLWLLRMSMHLSKDWMLLLQRVHAFQRTLLLCAAAMCWIRRGGRGNASTLVTIMPPMLRGLCPRIRAGRAAFRWVQWSVAGVIGRIGLIPPPPDVRTHIAASAL